MYQRILVLHVPEKKRLSDFFIDMLGVFSVLLVGAGSFFSFVFFFTTAKYMNAKAYRSMNFDFYGFMLEAPYPQSNVSISLLFLLEKSSSWNYPQHCSSLTHCMLGDISFLL